VTTGLTHESDSLKGSLVVIGLGIVALVGISLTSELHAAIGLLVLISLMLSAFPNARMGILILLLPFAHAGLGLEPLRGFGSYDIYAGLFLIIFVLRFISRDLFTSRRIPVLGYTGIMFICFVPSLLNSIDLTVSAIAFIQFLVSALTAAGVCYYLIQESNQKIIYLLLALFVVEAAATGAYGIYESYTSRSFMRGVTGRVFFGPFQDVNYYASYLLMAVPFALGSILLSKRFLWKVVWFFVAILLITSIISTVSRAGILTLALVILSYGLYLTLVTRGPRRLLGLSVLLFFFSVVSVLLFSEAGSKLVDLFTLSRRLETVVAGRDPSLDQRQKIFEVGTRIAIAHPFVGIGFGAFEKTFDTYRGASLSPDSPKAAHNTALRLFAETGFVGFIPSLFFALVVRRFLFKAYRKIPDERHRIMMGSVILSLFSFFLMSLTLDAMFEPHFWVMLGIAVASASKYIEQDSKPSPIGMAVQNHDFR
jgi:O-antigen ligase